MKRSWLTKSVGILAAMGLIAALCGAPVSAAPMVIQQTQAQASFVATAPTVTTQNATGTVVNANGQTAGYFHGTLTTAPNMAGMPTISMPVEKVDGLPVGMQIIADQFKEGNLIKIAHKFEVSA